MKIPADPTDPLMMTSYWIVCDGPYCDKMKKEDIESHPDQRVIWRYVTDNSVAPNKMYFYCSHSCQVAHDKFMEQERKKQTSEIYGRWSQ